MKTLSVLMAILFMTSCGGGGGSDTPQTAPVIDGVHLVKPDQFSFDDIPQDYFFIGEKYNVEIRATDPDLDMAALYVNQYLLPNLDSPFYQTVEIVLPTQEGPQMMYFFIEDQTILGPVGDWRVCFMIVDAAGNESEEFCIHVVVADGMFWASP